MDPITAQAIEDIRRFQEISNELAREHIVAYEEWAKANLYIGKITQEDAWDLFFGLLHECDERGLIEDRRRMLTHIDTKRYNPFRSKGPEVRFLAMLRARAFGLTPHDRN